MPFTPKFVDLVRNVTTVQGTGPVSLGAAVSGYTSLADAVSAGDQFYYCIQGVDKPQEREVGRGTMQSDGRVARQAILGGPTNFTTGAKTIALVTPAEWFARLDQIGAGALAVAASRPDLASKDQAAVTRAYLGEAGRGGSFQFDPANLSAKVAADPNQGIYVAPTAAPSGASGAWVRQFTGPIDPRWFGVAEGTGNGAANSAAFAAMLATLRARAANVFTNYQGLETVRFPAGLFEFASTIEISDGTLILEGSSSGFSSAHSTKLKFPAGVTGIRVQRYNTSGAATTDSPTHRGSDGTTIRNLSLAGGYTATEGEFHGIHLRAKAAIENVYVELFEGDGIHINATSGGGINEGNANYSRIMGGSVLACRNGIYLDGADANQITVIGADLNANRRWGFWDSSYLGCMAFGLHTSSNGLVPGSPPTVVSHNGNRYTVIHGQEAGASTNAPSGTAGGDRRPDRRRGDRCPVQGRGRGDAGRVAGARPDRLISRN